MFQKISIILLLAVLTAACGNNSDEQTGASQAPALISVTSPAFEANGAVPQKYTCDGENISPALAWMGVPEQAVSLVLIVDDPDAPVGTWVHWVRYDIPPTVTGLGEGAGSSDARAGTGTPGENSFKNQTYGGPCPPGGPAHHYSFRLYALDTLLNLEAGANKGDVEKAMQDHVLAQGELVGMYGK